MLDSNFHPEAEAELLAAGRYIKGDDDYVCFDGEFRKIRVGKFRYNLVFRIRGEEIQILAVMHMSRRPGYWKKRATTWPE